MRAWFLNLGPSSTTAREADADILAISRSKPELIMGAEAVGKHPLIHLPGYEQIVSTRNGGRANLWAYALGGADHVAWEDCHIEFPRAEHPGEHPPRSILKFNYHGLQVHDAHKPPLWKGAAPAREEHDARLARSMAPWLGADWDKRTAQEKTKAKGRSRLLLWDCNGIPAAKDLADRVDGRLVGDKIDNAVVRNIRVKEWAYREGVRRHQFATDHPWGAFFIRFDVTP